MGLIDEIRKKYFPPDPNIAKILGLLTLLFAAVSRIEQKGGNIMNAVDQLLGFVKNIDEETDRIAIVVSDSQQQIASLQAQIAAGTPITAEQLQQVNDALSAEVGKLQAIGKTPPATDTSGDAGASAGEASSS